MRILLSVALTLPTLAWAVGGDWEDTPPPKPAVTCPGSQVYDEQTNKCVDPEQSGLDRDTLYRTVRQLAYAGRYRDAQRVMAALPAQDQGRLTYMGFTHRKLGNVAQAASYYQQAIAQDPANILARSYMGQGFVAEGRLDEALDQLLEIRSHGGTGTWAETSLRRAIATGTTYDD
ncbi:tetratricopeptide repeat protein [Roseobacter weihaiensis]|uniref:tetratricopeptide repeat protein n=1 Tax=Roseobacter weihaiensis TaxID=2763262 RepID=UPI001D0B7BDB|nr:tetratricopeptide repeat protein [Roseobacter sp. H9]